jgi:uncharacterized protein (DUF1499 family)
MLTSPDSPRKAATWKKVLLSLGLVLASVIAVTALHTALTQGDTVFAGRRPSTLGVTDGRLASPKRTPNCVSSQADRADEHYIAPIKLKGSAAEAMASLRKLLEGRERVTVVKQEGPYLYAEFKSKTLGFVDDVELLVAEKEGVIHVRSASRLGRRDFGVNRARVEWLRDQIGG